MNNSAHDNRSSPDQSPSVPPRFHFNPLDQHRITAEPPDYPLSQHHPHHTHQQLSPSPHHNQHQHQHQHPHQHQHQHPHQHHHHRSQQQQQQHHQQQHALRPTHQRPEHDQSPLHHPFRFNTNPSSAATTPDMKSSILHQPTLPVQPYPSIETPASTSSMHFSSISDAHHSIPHTSFVTNSQHTPIPSPNTVASVHAQVQQRASVLSSATDSHQTTHHVESQQRLQQAHTHQRDLQSRSPPQQLPTQHSLLRPHHRNETQHGKPHFHHSPQPDTHHYSPRGDVTGTGNSSSNIASNFSRMSPQHLPLQSDALKGGGGGADAHASFSSPLYGTMSSKLPHAPMPSMQHRFNIGGSAQHIARSAALKSENIPSMPLPMHPDPVQPFQPVQDVTEPERSFSFARHGFFEDLPHEDSQPSGALPPPAPPTHDSDHGNTLGAVEGALPPHLGGIGPNSNVTALPAIAGSHSAGLHTVGAYGASNLMGVAIGAAGSGVGGPAGSSDMSEGLGEIGKVASYGRKIRPMARTRAQQMTESQRKQRHNEHTRASRSRIDRGLERLKAVIKKVRPQQKVNKKADVLHEAVKLLKEGFRLPPTESDDERDEPQESSLSV